MRVLWLLIFSYTWNSPRSILEFSFCRNLDLKVRFTLSRELSTYSGINFGQGRGSSQISDYGIFCISDHSYNQNSATGQSKCCLPNYTNRRSIKHVKIHLFVESVDKIIKLSTDSSTDSAIRFWQRRRSSQIADRDPYCIF